MNQKLDLLPALKLSKSLGSVDLLCLTSSSGYYGLIAQILLRLGALHSQILLDTQVSDGGYGGNDRVGENVEMLLPLRNVRGLK